MHYSAGQKNAVKGCVSRGVNHATFDHVFGQQTSLPIQPFPPFIACTKWNSWRDIPDAVAVGYCFWTICMVKLSVTKKDCSLGKVPIGYCDIGVEECQKCCINKLSQYPTCTGWYALLGAALCRKRNMRTCIACHIIRRTKLNNNGLNVTPISLYPFHKIYFTK